MTTSPVANTTQSATLISMRDIKKAYRSGEHTVMALDGVSFDIFRGEFVAILGPSGSGKSTLMNILGCIDVASEGEYVLDGRSIVDRDDDELAAIRNRKIGFVFQSFNLLSRHSALYNVQLPLLLRGEPRSATLEPARRMLELVGLADRTHHKPLELSGGQQQRVAIARALVGQPEIILADELTGALDSATGEEILSLLSQLNRLGNTIILITHDLNVAARARRTIELKDGIIIRDECREESDK